MGRDLLAGAIAGAVGVWALDRVDWKLYRAGGPERIKRTEAARPGGMDPAHALADKLGVGFGGDKKDNAGGHAVHYTIGIGGGALYGLLRGMSPAFATGRGALFGLALWIIEDEGLNTVLGTAGNPLAYPWQDHARGIAGHTTFGIVTDLVARVLAPWRDKVVIVQGPPLRERLAHVRDALPQLPDRQRLADARDAAQDAARQAYSRARAYTR